MARSSPGKRYAAAIFQLAREKDQLDEWRSDLEKIAGLTADEQLRETLESPRVGFLTKKERLQERLGEINPLALNLALLLVARARLKIARSILKEYSQLLDDHHGIVRTRVTTASPLEESEINEISRRLGEAVQRRVMVESEVDQSIIGGIRARLGDMLIDGSVRYRLESLRKTLSG